MVAASDVTSRHRRPITVKGVWCLSWKVLQPAVDDTVPHFLAAVLVLYLNACSTHNLWLTPPCLSQTYPYFSRHSLAVGRSCHLRCASKVFAHRVARFLRFCSSSYLSVCLSVCLPLGASECKCPSFSTVFHMRRLE